MSRPWLFTFGPWIIPADAREELNALGVGLSTPEYINKVWDARLQAAPPRKRPRSKSWPKSSRIAKGPFILRRKESNVTQISRRKS